VSIEVFVADEQSDHPVDALRWDKLAREVLRAEKVRGDAELSVLFVDETTIAGLNERFLGKSGPTDVLAFPLDDDPDEPGRWPDAGGPAPGREPPEPGDLPMLLGDVVICPSIAARNAPDHAGTYEDELALLLVHGILHLLGMDHIEEADAEKMEARERELLSEFHEAS
jgi:probable rRNA maturation factor